MPPVARFENADWRPIPQHLQEPLRQWLRTGQLPHSYFLNMLLRNDLMATIGAARIDEWAALHGIVHFLHAECPAEAYGDVESWIEWRAIGGWRGMWNKTEKLGKIYEF